MLAKKCIDCKNKKSCSLRFITVKKGEFVYCNDGSKLLVDINNEWMIQ